MLRGHRHLEKKITMMISQFLPITITMVLHLLLHSNNHCIIVRLHLT
jgi:hypothetical protein